MDHVINRIWIGSRRDAQRLADLRAAGITSVLAVAWDLTPVRQQDEGFHCRHVGLIDGPGNCPADFAAAILALDALLAGRPGEVLVHCHEGISRSPTVVAGWMVLRCMAPDVGAALNSIARARPRIAPHAALVKAVAELDWLALRRLVYVPM